MPITIIIILYFLYYAMRQQSSNIQNDKNPDTIIVMSTVT